MNSSSSSGAMPSLNCYVWEKFSEDTDLARALTSHRKKQPSEDSHAAILRNTPSEQRPQLLIDFLNKSAERNVSERRPAARWQLGTLDVLALAQHGLETFSDAEQMFAVRDMIKALPHMENQTQAHAFARAFIPLLSNWLRNPTDNKSLDDDNIDRVKTSRLLGFFTEINELDGKRENLSLDVEQSQKVLGIQRAVYTALPANTFDVFDEAFPPAVVFSLTKQLKQIGDKLVESPELANDPALSQIREMRNQAEQHRTAAMKRRAALRDQWRAQKTAAQQGQQAATVYIAPAHEKSGEHKQILSQPVPAGVIKSNSSSASDLQLKPVEESAVEQGSDNLEHLALAASPPSASAEVESDRPSTGNTNALDDVPTALGSLEHRQNVDAKSAASSAVSFQTAPKPSSITEVPRKFSSASLPAAPEATLPGAVAPHDLKESSFPGEPAEPISTEQVLPIRTRSESRKYFKWFLGPKYPPAFSLPAPSQATQQDEPQSPAPPGFREFVIDSSSTSSVPKNVRVKAQPKHDSEDLGRAFTLTDSNKTKMDFYFHETNPLGALVLERSGSPSQFWNFREDANKNWQADPSVAGRKSAMSSLQKILHRADSGERKGRDNERQGRK